MNLDVVNEILSRITYKPGFKIKAMRHSYLPEIEIRFYQYGIPNALKPDEQSNQPLVSQMLLSEECFERLKNPEQFLIERIRHQVITMELHEVDEWLKFNDVCVTDPHPEFKKSSVKF